MRVSSRLGLTSLLALCLGAAAPALAADTATPPASTPAPTSPSGATAVSGAADRLFLSFAQDAAIVPSQWWEGQIEYAKGNPRIPVDVWSARGVVAFQPFRNIEVGGRFGFANSKSSQNRPDGTGATDLDAYAKYYFGNAAEGMDFTAGALVTVPTGDDTSGLGYNAFAAQAFGGMRYRLPKGLIGGHIGVRMNGNGRFQGAPLDGKASFELAVNFLAPLSSEVSVLGEARIETERFKGATSTADVLAGVNWRAFGRGMLRGAVGAGLTDSAPKFRILVGYAYTF